MKQREGLCRDKLREGTRARADENHNGRRKNSGWTADENSEQLAQTIVNTVVPSY